MLTWGNQKTKKKQTKNKMKKKPCLFLQIPPLKANFKKIFFFAASLKYTHWLLLKILSLIFKTKWRKEDSNK